MSSTESQDQRRLTFIFSWASQWDPLSGVELRNFNRTNALFKYMFFKITRPFRRWIDPRSAHMIPIHLTLITQSRTRASIHSPIDIAEPKLFGERRFMVPISDAIAERDVYKEIIAGYLSTMIVLLGNTETTIMQTIYKAIEKAEAGWPIDVVVMSVTVNILGKSVVVPTTESVFHRLDNVRLDNLESSTRQKPCRLCSKSLDHFHDGGEGITRLPCSPHFSCRLLCPVFGAESYANLPHLPSPTPYCGCTKSLRAMGLAFVSHGDGRPYINWSAYWQIVYTVEATLRKKLIKEFSHSLPCWDVLPLVFF